MTYPFEVEFNAIQNDLEPYVDAVFDVLQSDFLTLPRGDGFVDYATFEQGYEALKKATLGFQEMSSDLVCEVIQRVPVSFVVLRTMLGFTPPEWGDIATKHSEIQISQGAVRTLDRRVRMQPLTPIQFTGVTLKRLSALVDTACHLLQTGAPTISKALIHRLDKADTRDGLHSLRPLSQLGVPYAMLLYERLLGRPFASHRDSVSDIVGDVLEAAIENVLTHHGISYRKTKRAQRIEGFDQAPDFVIPDEFNPRVVIEAKITEDDGTARDKVTRLQHLGSLSQENMPPGEYKYEVIACIAGRGFKVRREDMKKLLLATRGKVFTLQNLDCLVEHTALKDFKTKG